MTLTEVRAAFPRTYRLIVRLVEQHALNPRVIDGLSEAAFARIEAGDTPERDVRVLLVSRLRLTARR